MQRNRNKFNCLLIISILMMALILLGNVAVLIWGKCEKSNWLTLISGWLGFFATLGIGIISLVQGEKYTLMSCKQELICQLNKEFDLVVEFFSKICSYDAYTDSLKYLVGDYKNALLQYKSELSSLQATICDALLRIQLLNYSRNHLDEAVLKIDEIISWMEEYKKPLSDKCTKDDELTSFIQKIDSMAKKNVCVLSSIRNKVFIDYKKTIEEINACKNMMMLENLKKQILEQNAELRKKVDVQITKDMKILEDKYNG